MSIIWISANFSSTAVGRQSRGVQQETLLQRDLQAVGEKGNQNVRVGAVLQLMVNGEMGGMPSSLLRDRKTDSICVNCT
jgi:hypothetical protein